MSDTITTQHVKAFDTALRLEAQQQVSRLMSTVNDRGTIVGSSFTINGLGTGGELDENTTRHGDTVFSDPEHTARNAVMKDFYKAFPMDRADVAKVLANPITGGHYMKLLMAAKNRKIDDMIYAAGLGSIASVDGLSTFTLPAAQIIVNGATGFTKAKIIAAKAIFRANEADENNGEELYMLYNDVILSQVLADTTLTSADHTTVQLLQSGKLDHTWCGFKWVPYQRFTKVSTVYSGMAYCKSAIDFGTGYEEGKISPRPDKKDLTQASMAASYGAGRQSEKKVVQIDFV
ncbi:MAG: phage capsid protein [Burkholderiaceae bacterium]|mgnify:CR=1 FL=1|nr:phage capsid protein [Burkholderiaceae bacterium]